MSGLKIYGVPRSRAFRVLWLAGELGLRFEHVPLGLKPEELKSPAYLAVNPNGKIPAIDDDGFTLWESMAINLYLARKHGGPLQPDTLADEALTWQWSFWAVTEVEEPLLTVLLHRALKPEAERDAAAAAAAEARLAAPFTVLDGALQDGQYLLGEGFTVADLNLASVLAMARLCQLDLGRWPRLEAWLGRCLTRPAARAVR